MFIISYFLEYILFFILLVVLVIALLNEYGKISINSSLYVPTVLLGLGLNCLFFDIFTDPILGVRSSLFGLAIGFLIGIILCLLRFINKYNFYLFLAISAFLGIYRIFGFLIIFLGITGLYFLINLITKCKYLAKIRHLVTNGFLICISGIIYCIIILI